MAKPADDPVREDRIAMEIVVDAHDEQERAMGWYYYLEEKLTFPFLAHCITKRAISPLRVKDEVEVIGMPGEDECQHEIFVTIRCERNGLAVPLSQLVVVSADSETTKAVEDWHYWVQMGYEF